MLLGVLLIGVLAGAVIERDPLMQLTGLKATASTSALPSTGATTTPTPTPTPSPTPTVAPILVEVPNVTCMTPLVAQQAIEKAGFRFVGSFVANQFYPRDVVFKSQPLALGQAPRGSDVTAFVSTGPDPGTIAGRNPCLQIFRVLPPDIYQRFITPAPTP